MNLINWLFLNICAAFGTASDYTSRISCAYVIRTIDHHFDFIFDSKISNITDTSVFKIKK